MALTPEQEKANREYMTKRKCCRCGHVYNAYKAKWELGHSICPKCGRSSAYSN